MKNMSITLGSGVSVLSALDASSRYVLVGRLRGFFCESLTHTHTKTRLFGAGQAPVSPQRYSCVLFVVHVNSALDS